MIQTNSSFPPPNDPTPCHIRQQKKHRKTPFAKQSADCENPHGDSLLCVLAAEVCTSSYLQTCERQIVLLVEYHSPHPQTVRHVRSENLPYDTSKQHNTHRRDYIFNLGWKYGTHEMLLSRTHYVLYDMHIEYSLDWSAVRKSQPQSISYEMKAYTQEKLANKNRRHCRRRCRIPIHPDGSPHSIMIKSFRSI